MAALAGCAWVFHGMSQEVKFDSEPPGASFTVGGRAAATPATLTVPKEDYVVVFSLPGHRDATFDLKRQVHPWFYGSLAMGAVASAVGILTGAWKESQTTDVRDILEPIEERPEERPLRATSEPSGAEVLVGEAVYGRTPGEIQLAWRRAEVSKEVTFRLPRYRVRALKLEREEKELHAVMEALPQIVRVQVTSKPARGTCAWRAWRREGRR
jgi:hypothetical protein